MIAFNAVDLVGPLFLVFEFYIIRFDDLVQFKRIGDAVDALPVLERQFS